MDLSSVCPWQGVAPTGFYFCERALCGWIQQPGNTFSNLAYVASALWILARYKLRELALALGILGLASAYFHSALSFFGEVLDLGGMFLLLGLFVVWILERAVGRRLRKRWLVVLMVAGLPTAAMGIFGSIGAPLFQALLLIVVAAEVWLIRQGKHGHLPSLALASVVLAVAYGLWWADVSELWCNPDNHLLSGHVLWHALTAWSMIPLARYYASMKP